jgi:UDP-N-acetylglucosamine/UDP-N-acetylgalactosamine diphosphorylase
MVLSEKNRLFRNPDGHGGSLTAISSSGALDWLKEKGIECVSYFQVDNPLVRIVDPVFVGYHEKDSADITSKCLKKTGPHEKVGIFVTLESGNIGVVEYSDLSEEKATMTDDSGELVYSAGSPAIHLFRVSFLEELTRGGRISLPFHTAKKNLEVVSTEGEKEIKGYKFEKFVFDALPLTDKNVIIEAARDEEFAPVKNATGTDSAESAREKISNLHRRWLEERKIDVPGKVRVVEIAPSLAVEAEDLPADLEVPSAEKVYLE